MQITKTLYVTNRRAWRAWLAKNGAKAREIWLVYYNKASRKPRIPYNDAVEEALCFGWIDGQVKKGGADWFAQRFTPRRKGSLLSQMNKERVCMMIKQGKMTPAGLEAIAHAFNPAKDRAERFAIPKDVLKALKADKLAWKHFQAFPEHYKRIRVAYVEEVRKTRPAEYPKRLANFLKLTRQNKRFGMMR